MLEVKNGTLNHTVISFFVLCYLIQTGKRRGKGQGQVILQGLADEFPPSNPGTHV